MKWKPWTELGAEQLFRPLVFLFTFLFVSMLCISYMSPAFAQRDIANRAPSENEYPFLLDYELWNPTDGVNVSAIDDDLIYNIEPIKNPLQQYPTPSQTWTHTDQTDVRLYVVNDDPDGLNLGGIQYYYSNYLVFLIDYTDWDMMSPALSVYHFDEVAIPYSAIIDGASPNGNVSIVSFELDSKNYSATFNATTSNSTSFDERVIDNDFTIHFGMLWTNYIEEVALQQSAITIIFQLMTLQLPDCDPFINIILAVPLWISIAFIALTIISRFIPLIPGG